MPSAARYEPSGEWREHDRTRITDDGALIAQIDVEVADCHDKRTGDVFASGTYRVTIMCAKRPHGCPRSKTFFGESAWSDSERYARDAHWWIEDRKRLFQDSV